MLRSNAPQLRTVDAILSKNEQILDGMELGRVTPKMGEQMSQCCKTPILLAKLEMSYFKMVSAFGRKAPVPRQPILRSMLGLDPNAVALTDGEAVRALLPE